MKQKILKTLEYGQVKDQLRPFLSTERGQRELAELTPTSDAQQMQQWLQETADATKLVRWKGGLKLPKLVDVTALMKRVKIDADLNGSELAQVGRTLFTTGQLHLFFDQIMEEKRDDLIGLQPYYSKLAILPDVTRRLNVAIDQDGRVTDEASVDLHRIRQTINGHETAIRQRMQDYTKGKMAKYLSDPIVTMRNERYVIPVKAEYKSQFGGIVHDQSQTGQTLYIEPADVVDLNNRLRESQLKELAEEARILHELTQMIQPVAADIEQNDVILGRLDFINAKALHAHKTKATEPEFSAENHVRLLEARHPLLDADKAVANDIIIGEDYQAIIITGPNTGGKTITLKTLGLLQLMAQSGLFIPASEHSTVGVFREIFADIGDEQSIEQSLSTFSSHMVNIVDILADLGPNDLVLFDELGAGTDPQEGAAIAMGILDAVGETGAYSVATTHYPELKVYGYNRTDTINASMEFDVETLRPTYHFLLGIPGRSNALEISKRLGLRADILDKAASLADDDSQELNDMIAELVARRNAVLDQQVQLSGQLIENKRLKREYDDKLDKIDVERAKVIEQAKQEANHIVADTKKRTEKLIAELREMKRSGANIKENKLMDAKGALNQMAQQPSAANNKVLKKAKAAKNQDIAEGDTVLVREYGQQGTVLRKLKNDQYEIQMGILKMQLKADEIEKQAAVNQAQQSAAQKRSAVKRQPSAKVSTNKAVNRMNASAKLDLRGHRYEQAMGELDRFIDQALLNNLSSVEIIHGKGTGAIRQGVQEYLRSHRSVKTMNYTGPDQGATYAELS